MVNLGKLKPPLVIAVIVERSSREARLSVDAAFREGADAAELNLACLRDPPERVLRRDRAIYTSCRRAAFMAAYGPAFASLPVQSDEMRMGRQLAALRAGSCGLDIEADCFAPSHDEWTANRAAVRRQRAVASAAHTHGAAVIFSWHPPRRVRLAEARRRAMTLRERGADFVKIVERVETFEAALDMVRISFALKAQLGFPFVFLGLGAPAIPFRPLMTRFGAAYLLARPSRGANRIAVQPLVPVARTLVDFA